MNCPLCHSDSFQAYAEDKQRQYLRCCRCGLVYVPEKFHLSAEQERAQYDLHQNSPDDIHYRGFLSRLFKPMLERLQPAAQGLDFGCGPGPTLSLMFEEKGFSMEVYDKFYAAHDAVLRQQYDFITCTEVAEHFHRPDRELQCLLTMLKPAGYLGMMTKLVMDEIAFQNWHYKNDPTHIIFFSEPTFEWLAEEYGLCLELLNKDVIILKKPV